MYQLTVVVVVAAGDVRPDRPTAGQTAVSRRRPKTGNRAQREATGTGRGDGGRPDAARTDSVDTRSDATAAPGRHVVAERCHACTNR